MFVNYGFEKTEGKEVRLMILTEEGNFESCDEVASTPSKAKRGEWFSSHSKIVEVGDLEPSKSNDKLPGR